MRQFDNQGALTLSGDHSTSGAVVAEAWYMGFGISQMLTSRKKLYWSGLDWVEVRTSGVCCFGTNASIKWINL